MTDSPIESVSDTAFWIAHYRAAETERPDALFRDPLAGVLSGEHGKRIAKTMPMGSMIGWVVAIRTCIIDDYVRFAVGQGVDTVLNLGAGLDTRPYRLDLPPSLLWVEADYPRVIGFKEEKLLGERPRCQLERVELDLAKESERGIMLAGINARSRKMLVLTEGVVTHLSLAEAGSLADDLRGLDHLSYWIIDYLLPELAKYQQRGRMQQKMRNAPFKFTPSDWFGFFQKHGWRTKEIRYLAAEGKRLGRPLRLPFFLTILLKIRILFTSRQLREAFPKFTAYVILEPSAAT